MYDQKEVPLLSESSCIFVDHTLPSTVQTIKNIWNLFKWPMLSWAMYPLFSVINTAVCGRLGEVELAALGLGNLTLQIILISICTLYASACIILMSPAAGAKDYRLLRVYLNRQYVLNTMLFSVQMIPLLCIRSIYTAMGQDEDVAQMATRYVHIVMWGIYGHMQSMSVQEYAQAQGKTLISFLNILLSTIVHILAIFIFVRVLGWGFTGVCFATFTMQAVKIVISILYINTVPEFQHSFYGGDKVLLFSKESFTGLWPQFKCCVGFTIMLVQGWWAFDILTLMSSFMSMTVIEAQTILSVLGVSTFMIPMAVIVSGSVLIGNAIGQGSKSLVMHYYKWLLYTGVALALVQSIFLITLRDQIIGIFTNNTAISDVIKTAWPIFIWFAALDVLQGISCIPVRSAQKQKLGSLISFCSYWVIGLSIAGYFGFKKHMECKGLWVGPSMACTIQFILYLIISYRTDWRTVIKNSAKERKQQSKMNDRNLIKNESKLSSDWKSEEEQQN